tara:strand:+ start:679 stop:1194 length:516 start_codon:yes stop_codon:yes gene_type:complete
MLKGKTPKGIPEPFKSGQFNKNTLVYIGNVYGANDRTWPTAGTELRAYDVFRRVQVSKPRKDRNKGLSGALRTEHINAKKKTETQKKHTGTTYHTLLRMGISRGDAFLTFGSGAGFVVRKRRDGEGYWLSRMKKAERASLVDGERHVRRNLRWARGSFCEGQETSKWVAKQ